MSPSRSRQAFPKAPRLTPCPPRLKAIIDVLDLLPAGAALANLSYLQDQPDQIIQVQLGEYLKALPGEFVKHIWTGLPAELNTTPSSKQLQSLRKAATKLFGAAWANQTDEDVAGLVNSLDLMKTIMARKALIEYEFYRQTAVVLRELGKLAFECRNGETSTESVCLIPARINIDRNGIGRADRNRLIEALDEQDLSRIRECEACGRIFWAGRHDQKGCSSESCKRKIRKKKWKQKRDQGYYQGANSLRPLDATDGRDTTKRQGESR